MVRAISSTHAHVELALVATVSLTTFALAPIASIAVAGRFAACSQLPAQTVLGGVAQPSDVVGATILDCDARLQVACLTLPTIVATATTIGADTEGCSVAVAVFLVLAGHLFTLLTHESGKAFTVAVGTDTGDVASGSAVFLRNTQLFVTFCSLPSLITQA